MENFNYQINKIELADSTFSLLPNVVRQFTSLYDSNYKKSLALFSAMIAISGILPNYQFSYNNRRFDPNLFGFVYGKFGSGKSQMMAAKDLLSDIKLYIETKVNQVTNIDKIITSKEVGNAGLERGKKLQIPANTSKNNIYELLKENNERGIILEAEADTLIGSIKSKTGNFTDILRNAFDNESISNSFKGERTYIEIKRPVITILVSGTENQLLNLFANKEDGFMSRFFLFELEPTSEIVAPKNEYRLTNVVKNLISKQLLKLYKNLELQKSPILFEFTDEQTVLLTKRFNEYLDYFNVDYNGELNGLVTRYYFLIRRIAMIFSILRTENLSQIIVCDDNSFKLSRRLMRFFFNEFERAFNLRKKIDTSRIEANIDAREHRLNQIRQAKYLKVNRGLGPSEISKIIFGDDSHKGTVSKWINIR